MSSTQIAASPNSKQIKQALFQGANFEVAYYMAIDGQIDRYMLTQAECIKP